MLSYSARVDFLYTHALTCCLGVHTPLIHPMNSRDGRSYVTHNYTHYVINTLCQFHLEMHPTLPALGAHFLVLVVWQRKKDFAYVGKPLANTSKHLLGQTLLSGVGAPMYERVD